jgi:hypothetical protein
LNRLAASDEAVAVRSVQVTPEEMSAKPNPAQAGSLVAPGWARFVVTVEFTTLVSSTRATF